MRASFWLPVLFALGCEVPPQRVSKMDIDAAMGKQNWKTICRGLQMKDEGVRRYAASKVKEIQDPDVDACLCKEIASVEKGWDAAIAEGIQGATKDSIAACFAEAVARPDLPNRLEAVVALGKLPAPAARKGLIAVAAGAGEPEVRARALAAVGGDKSFKADFLTLLKADAAPVRAAAADALGGITEPDAIAALQDAVANDADGEVRGAALAGLKKSNVPEADQMLCKAMMDDASPAVRKKAIQAYQGTKRPEAIACLRTRALALEEDAEVRDTLLAVLKSSPRQEAADVLCDAIPFWLKSYVKDAAPPRAPGANIIKIQNDRDWEKSLACVQKALGQSGGWSCYGRMYANAWAVELGGKNRVQLCPGYEDGITLE